MSFYFSKSKFVSACTRCNKYAWLDKYKSEEKAPVSDFAQSLFDNGHKVGELAKEYFNIDVDVTAYDENGKLDLSGMIENTNRHLSLGTKAIAEASFNFGGFFCSVDILVRNTDGTYNIYEVKSSKPEKPTKKEPVKVKEKYKLDAAYQRYVLEKCGIRIKEVYIVQLNRDYIRGKDFEIDKYFIECDVTVDTTSRLGFVADKLLELEPIITNSCEPATNLCKNCNGCDYFGYCTKHIPSPSPFDVYNLKFEEKCCLHSNGVSFFDIPKVCADLKAAAKLQIEYYNRPDDTYIDKNAIKDFLSNLSYPLYSLDFETYQAVVPEFEGIKTYEQVPFQYSLHVIEKPDQTKKLSEFSYLNITGSDTRRDIAESLVSHIPYGACIVAYHKSTEKGIIEKLASNFPDLSDHLLSFTYTDPLEIFTGGHYYVKAMGKSFSLKSVAPALYPNDRDMDYHNLEGNIKNGTQAMKAFDSAKTITDEEREKIEEDLKKYCALDTYAVVKILKKLYDATI